MRPKERKFEVVRMAGPGLDVGAHGEVWGPGSKSV